MEKVALITGGSGTIGGEIARKLSKEGYNIVITYNSSEKRALEVLSTLNQNRNNSMFKEGFFRNKI